MTNIKSFSSWFIGRIQISGLLVVMSWFSSHAQQDPIYAQYLINPLTINPAYAGINDQFSARLQYRTQWAGLEANPKTFNFSSNLSILQNKAGVGLMVMHDQLGDIKNTELAASFAYKIKSENRTFSFGMQAGFLRNSNDPSLLTIRDPGDPYFAPYSETNFNTGAGVMLTSDKYRIGFSVPRLLPTTFKGSSGSIELYQQHYYLFGSYNFLMNERWTFKPSVLMRGTKGAPFSADLNATFIYRNNYSGGIFTRGFNSYGLLMQMLVKNFSLAYVFELPGSSASSLQFTSHEITLGITTGLFTYHSQVPKVF